MKVPTGKSYKRVSLFKLSLMLVIGGLGVAVPLYLSQLVHAVPAIGPVFIDTNTNGIYDPGETTFSTIQAAVNAASSGNTIGVSAGTYVEVGQIVINKNLNIVGADKITTIIKPNQDTGNPASGDLRAWFLVNPGVMFNLSNVTLDGSGKLVAIAILSRGGGTIENNVVKNIGYNPSTDYYGRGIQLYDTNMTVRYNTLQNIGRIGIFAFGSGVTSAVIEGNNYTGKGVNNWLDYGIEVGGGAVATISNNTISGNRGVANDGSTSAGILVSTYFAPGTQAVITGNTLTDNTNGIAVGYDSTDTAVVTAHNNKIYNNSDTGISTMSNTVIVNATNNWWGSASGPYDNKTLLGVPNYNNPSGTGNSVTSYVDYKPWFTNIGMTTLSSANPTTEAVSGEATTGATVNGTNGDYDASNTSFWWGTSSAGSFTSATDPSGQLPSDWIHAPIGTGAQSAGASFNYAITGLTPGTTYHFVAWSLVDGTWYPGEVKSFTTAPIPDTTPPGVPTNGLPNSSYKITNNFYFTWDTSTDNNPAPITYEYQSSLNSAQSDGVLTTDVWHSGILTSNTIHSTGAPDGTWYWQVRAVDAANNKSAWSPIWNVTLDTKAPAVPGNPSPTNQNYVNTHDFTFSWDAVRDPSTPVSYEWEFSYGTAVKDDGSFTSRSGFHSLASAFVNSPGTPDNIYYWHVRTIDSAGNKSAWSGPWKVTVDTTAPVITITGGNFTMEAGTAYVEKGATWTDIVDGTGDVSDITGSVDKLIPGDYTITYSITDTAGNIVTATRTVTVEDTTKPIVVLNPITSPNESTATAQVSQQSTTTPLTTTPQTTGIATNAGGGTVADTTGQVLGDQTSKANTNDKGTVKGDSTTKNNDNTWSFLGLAWYWWLLIVAAIIAAVTWWIVAARRRGNQNA